MTNSQPCFFCQLNRRLVSAQSLTREYELHTLECPSCKSLVRLVQKRSRANDPRHGLPLRPPATSLKTRGISMSSPGGRGVLATG
jgi:hypothetical protein